MPSSASNDALPDGTVLRLARLAVNLAGCLSFSRIVVLGAVFLVTAFLADCARRPRYPKSLPRMGYGDGPLATLRNWIGYTFHFSEWVQEGYDKHARNGRAFIVPSGASLPQEIVVPRSQTAWMLDLPDNILSTHHAHEEVLHSRYNMLLGANQHHASKSSSSSSSSDTAKSRQHQEEHTSFHNRVIHRNLARHLPGLLPALELEVAAAVDFAFGSGGDDNDNDNDDNDNDDNDGWHSVNLWEAWLAMVPRVTNRILIGEDVCREPRLLQHVIRFANAVVANGFVLNLFPRVLHPLVGRLLGLANWRHWRAVHGILEPLIRDRLRRLAADDEDEHEHKHEHEHVPEDYVTWHIRMAMAEGRVDELEPAAVSKSLMPMEFAAIHTTVLTGHSLLLDLLASDPARGFVEAIRAEVDAVRPADASTADSARQRPPWTKDQLARLWRTDSAIRESMRVSNFATSLIKRKVVAPDGLTNVAEGWHAPPGCFLVLNLAGMHHDPDLYVDPDSYDAFRFSRMREEEAGVGVNTSQLGMVTTSDHHLSFGHGRHACPGRFFIAHELKMILAYLVANYDVKPLSERPQPRWMGQTIIPPLDAKIEVRRRRPNRV